MNLATEFYSELQSSGRKGYRSKNIQCTISETPLNQNRICWESPSQRTDFLTEMFDVYESWSGKFNISAVFSVTNIGILFRHPYTWVLRHPVGLMDSSINCFFTVWHSVLVHIDVKKRSHCCCLSCTYCSSDQLNTGRCYSTLAIMRWRGGEKTVHVVFTVQKKPAVEKGWCGRSNASLLLPFFSADPWIFQLKTTYPLFSSPVFPSCSLYRGRKTGKLFVVNLLS